MDVPAARTGVDSGAGVPSPEEASFSSDPLGSAAFGAPNAKGRDLTGPSALSASGVLGGLPKPNPTGFPMLPALGNPLKKVPLLGEADPNENPDDPPGDVFSGVLVTNGFDPPVEIVPKNVLDEPEPEDVIAFDVSLSSVLSASLSLEASLDLPPKRLLPKTEVAEGAELPKNEGVELDDALGFENREEPDVDAPNVNGAGAAELVVEVADEEPKLNEDFGASEAAGSDAAGLGAKLNGLPNEFAPPVSTLGIKPDPDGVLEDVEDDPMGLKPEKPLGGAGIVKEGVAAGSSGSLWLSANFGAEPNDVGGFEGALEEVFGVSALSEPTDTRSDL